jgi:hypothetical protein
MELKHRLKPRKGDNLTTGKVKIIAKKIFSLTLTFNMLLSLIYAFEIVAGVWKLNTPYIPNDLFFLAMIPASIINIFPTSTIGRGKSGRLWFHHYVYGIIVAAVSATLLMISAPVSPISIFTFTGYVPQASINIGRFFILGGLTLIIDDLPDLSKKLSKVLSSAKSKAYQRRQIIHEIQFLMSLVSLYFFLAVTTFVIQKPEQANLANLFLISTSLVTSLTSFSIVKRKIWLNTKS